MQNLFVKKNNKISINSKYLRPDFDSLINSNFVFISFTDNYHYENYTEEEFSKINDYFKGRNITSNNFTKISINDNIKKNPLKFEHLNLDEWTIFNSFKIKSNTKNTMNIIIHQKYFSKYDKNLFMIQTFNEINNSHLMIVDSFLELLLYILKFERIMGKNIKFSKIINRYPHEFNELNNSDLYVYFNDLTTL